MNHFHDRCDDELNPPSPRRSLRLRRPDGTIAVGREGRDGTNRLGSVPDLTPLALMWHLPSPLFFFNSLQKGLKKSLVHCKRLPLNFRLIGPISRLIFR